MNKVRAIRPTSDEDVALEDDERSVNQNNSDADDWTFVSPPVSQSSSPASSGSSGRGETKIKSLKKLCEQDASRAKSSSSSTATTTTTASTTTLTRSSNIDPSQVVAAVVAAAAAADEQQQSTNEDSVSINGDDADDESDGMTEINLSDDNNYIANANNKISVEKKIKFASPLCTDDEDIRLIQLVQKHIDSRHSHNNKSTSSSSSSTTTTAPIVAKNGHSSQSQLQSQHSQSSQHQQSQQPDTTTIGRSPPQESRGAKIDHSSTLTLNLTARPLSCCLILLVLYVAIAYRRGQSGDDSAAELNKKLKQILDSSNRTFNFVYLDPANHAYTELKLLDEEMVDCIRRENPNLQEIKQWLSDDKSSIPAHDYNSAPNIKPFKGLVCYENEVEWRKKFNKLKTAHHIDLSKILKQVRRQLTYEMLELHHPSLRFKLIINQLEYLDFIDQRRKDRALERLKAENFELSRRTNAATEASVHSRNQEQSPGSQRDTSKHHSQHHHQQHRLTSNSLISLESENKRLRQENEALKLSLAEKAGTIYIKQSIELEKCERENNAFRQFHHQVNQEVSRGLKQLNLPITDFGAILSDRDESVSSPLAQTRNYLLRLVEEIGNIVTKNKGLQEELSEARILNAIVVHEAKNLVTNNNNNIESPMKSDTEFETNSTTVTTTTTTTAPTSNQSMTKAISSTTPEVHDESNSYNPANQCLTAQQMRDFNLNWLMKRARLRERLRRTSDTSSTINQAPIRASDRIGVPIYDESKGCQTNDYVAGYCDDHNLNQVHDYKNLKQHLKSANRHHQYNQNHKQKRFKRK